MNFILTWFHKKIEEFKRLPGTKEYHVCSGDLDVTVYAYNIDEAAKKAIVKYKPKNLGIIIQCNEVNKEEEYTLTERVLNELGHCIFK